MFTIYILCIHTYPIQINVIYVIMTGIYQKYCITEPLTESDENPYYLRQSLLYNYYYDYFTA